MFYREELNNGDSSWYNHHLQERQAKLGCIYHQIPIHIRPVSLNKESRDTPISHKVYAYRQAPKHIIGRRVSAFYENRETPISRIAGQRHEYTCSHERVNVRYRPIAPSENWEALVSGRSEPHHVYNHSLTHFNPPRSLIRENTECPSSYISGLRYQYNLELERRYQRKPPNENRNMPVSQRSGVRVKYMDKPIVNRYKTPILNKSKNAKSHEQMDNGCPQQSTTANRETCISHISKGRQIFNQELTGFSSPLTHYNRKPNDIDLPDTGIRAISGQTKPFIEDYFQNCDKKAYNIRCSSENAERLQEKEYFIRHESNPGIRRGESAERSVVDAIERMRIHFGAGDVEPMCLISGFEFENYLKHLKTADMIGHADRISAKRYLSRRDNGEHDILILHLNHGVTFIQVKAIGESMQVADSEGYWKAVKKRKDQHNRKIKDFIERALKQLDRDERMFRHVMKDLHLNIPVRKVVALPNIRRETLVNLSSSVSVLRQHLGLDALERCLFANEVHCRDVSDTSPLSLWWARNIQSYPGFKDVDTYKNVIDIYCNMMPTGKRPSSQAVPENCDTNMEVQTTEYNAEYNGTPIPDPCTCLTEESVAETEYSDTPVPDPCTFLTEESVAETEYSDTPVPDPGTFLTEESVAETEYSDTPVPDPCTCLTEESVAENEYSDTPVPDPCTCLTEEPVAETEYSDTPVPDPCTFLTEESVAETEYTDTPVPDPCTFLTEESVAETEYSDTPVPDPCTFLTEESVAVTEYSDNKMVLHTEDQDVETKPEEDEVGNSTKIPEKISHRVSLFHYKLSNDLEDSVKSGPTDFLFHELYQTFFMEYLTNLAFPVQIKAFSVSIWSKKGFQ
ncbi:uncharacterized protein LOC121369955 [Gigantopelta aegis]|uniref:uncharacterized protein LOC121369955 n=1 Tax=Gigantopelta aegis TaxID=1735272 RepID=UPI001B88A3A2|nr:uncharacterized protein LOC121369955 [Gigantopelta aegis]